MRVAERLMVIIPDRLSDLVRKGEITDRYYNPGDLFSEVHIVMTNDDRPEPAAVQPMVGRARLYLHNLPGGLDVLVKSLGWRPWLLQGWAEAAVRLATEIRPDLVRCHAARLNAFAARAIKRKLGIPYVVSLHINPDVDVRRGPWRSALLGHAAAAIEKQSLRDADLVLPVYRPIEPFLNRIGVRHYRVAYNVINPHALRQKVDYGRHRPVRVISVGRLIAAKDPTELIRAVAGLPDFELTIVGDGPIAPALRGVATELKAESRIKFRSAVPNDRLCAEMPDYDIFAIRSDYFELSKSMLEALLTGMPVIINRRPGVPVPELSDDICLLVENSAASYRAALQRLAADDALRQRLGQAAFAHAGEHWAPEKTEPVFARIYQEVLAAHGVPAG